MSFASLPTNENPNIQMILPMADIVGLLQNASQLCRELRQQGYRGQRSRVKEYLQPWRANSSSASSQLRRKLPNVRLVAFWLAKPPMQRTADEQRWVEAVIASHPQVATAEHLSDVSKRAGRECRTHAVH